MNVPSALPRWRRSLRLARHRLARERTDALAHIVASRRCHEVTVVLGLRRSGNHALIGWILDRTAGPAVFYNNIPPAGPPGSAVMSESRLRFGGPGRIVLGYEDASAAAVFEGPLSGWLAERARCVPRLSVVVILRDPHNLFASRLRKWPDRFADASEIAAERALYRAHLALAVAGGAPDLPAGAELVAVRYDRLVGSPAYRSALAVQLGLRPGAGRLEAVSAYGHGSSFDGTSLDGAALARRVLGRWQGMAGDPRLKAVLEDRALMAEAEAVFGPLPLDADVPG